VTKDEKLKELEKEFEKEINLNAQELQ